MNRTPQPQRRAGLTLAACALATLALTACGDPSFLRISGTAAVGAPVVGEVSATCASGTGVALSQANGSYTIDVLDGVGPCLVKITPANTALAPLYSVAVGTGSSFTANISPLTNMLVSYLQSVPGVTASTPEAWFALSATRALLSQPQEVQTRVVNDFIPAVRQLLPTFSLSGTGFLTTAFTAAAGDPVDDALEALRTANVVTTSGAPSSATSTTLAQKAGTAPPVNASGGGATGTGTGAGGS
jgi:hypothetical protein